MAGEPGSDPHGSLPLRRFLCVLLVLSFLVIWPGSADPWWRTKEWAVFILGLYWWIRRIYIQKPLPLVNPIFIGLLSYTAVQIAILQVLPVVQAQGKLFSSPWPWLVLIHIILASLWVIDSLSFLSVKDLNCLSFTLAIIGSFLSSYMLLQWIGIDPIISYIKAHYGGFKWLHDNHVIGLMGNPFQAGICLAVCLPAIVAFRFHIFSILGILAILATQSASGIVSSFLGVSLVLWRQARDLTLKIILSFGALGAFIGLHSGFFNNSNRFQIWNLSIQAWIRHPILGIGLGQYKMLGIIDPTKSSVRWAHNEWIQLLCEFGLIGFIFVIVYLDGLGKRCLKNWRRIPPEWLGIAAASLALTFTAIPWHLAPTAVVTLISLVSIELFTQKEIT